MLKIKDNVDLKELENFGFEYEPFLNQYYYVHIPKLYFLFEIGDMGNIVKINKRTRKIEMIMYPPYWETVNCLTHKNKGLKKLIKADMVEVVEEKDIN